MTTVPETLPPFMEIRFPTNISYGATGGCGWSTRVVVTDSGVEYRQQLWLNSRGKWMVGHNLRTPAQWAQLIAFHRVVLGKTIGFRFEDPMDYTDGGIGVFQIPPGGALPQLVKAYTQTDLISDEVYTNYRYIAKPQPGTIQIYFNGVLQTGWTLDYTTGLMSEEGYQDTGWTWTGNFDVPCRFDEDIPQMSMDTYNAVGWKGIPIIEIRV